MKIKHKDYVFKDGKFIGKFDELYQNCSDPWDLLKKNEIYGLGNLNHKIINYYCNQLKKKKKLITLEIGCGFPQISNQLLKDGFKVYGTDISETVIRNSKKKYPKLKNNLFVSNFLNFSLYKKINPDIIILSDLTWYILPKLKKFIKWYKCLKKRVYLIHSLTMYNKNEQKYGQEFFYDLNSLKSFFKLKYLSSGYFEDVDQGKAAFFLATNKSK